MFLWKMKQLLLHQGRKIQGKSYLSTHMNNWSFVLKKASWIFSPLIVGLYVYFSLLKGCFVVEAKEPKVISPWNLWATLVIWPKVTSRGRSISSTIIKTNFPSAPMKFIWCLRMITIQPHSSNYKSLTIISFSLIIISLSHFCFVGQKTFIKTYLLTFIKMGRLDFLFALPMVCPKDIWLLCKKLIN